MARGTTVVHQYLRHDAIFPHVWCPGCGNGIVLGALIRAVHHLGYPKDEIVLVSGIGCSSRMPLYVDFNTLHTVHGRALTFATGIKLANSRLRVIVVMGDGDAVAIGGNHFIHAARRNMDLTAIILNNRIYGMTGGQSSPTTPYGMYSTTDPYSHIEPAFDISEMAACAGATFVARSTVYHAQLLQRLMEKAIPKKGFSVVEVITHCHVQFGRANKLGTHIDMMKRQRDQAVPVEKAQTMSPEELKDKIPIGILTDMVRPVYNEEYENLKKRAGLTN